jgi:hypothetical protein
MFRAKSSLLKFHSFPLVLPSKMSHFGRCPKNLKSCKMTSPFVTRKCADRGIFFFCRLSQLIFITQHETNFLPISFTIRTAISYRNYRALSQNCEKLLLASLRLSVRPHRTRLSLKGFS